MNQAHAVAELRRRARNLQRAGFDPHQARALVLLRDAWRGRLVAERRGSHPATSEKFFRPSHPA